MAFAALGLWSGHLSAQAEAGFGVTAAVHGSVQLHPGSGSPALSVDSGEMVSPGDRLVTGEASGLQLLLTDNTVFTLGANTQFVLNEFTYDPETSEGEVKATVAQGVFKAVSGRTNDKKPGSTTVDMPTTTMVLRGTMIAGKADENGDTVVLLGPGQQRVSKDKKGSVAIIPRNSGLAAGDAPDSAGEILLIDDGFLVIVHSNGDITGPVKVSGAEYLEQFGLVPVGGGGPSQGLGDAYAEQLALLVLDAGVDILRDVGAGDSSSDRVTRLATLIAQAQQLQSVDEQVAAAEAAIAAARDDALVGEGEDTSGGEGEGG